ncbi:MAG: 16S rRNA (uracil1498-N3)-methyltransferase [Arenicella sp.]|jgi:16S rRNA (uracil1498-N3)-methyltransferase
MSTPTFFHANLSLGDTSASLEGSEIAHARNSRRLKTGQEIKLLNGNGLVAECEIDQIGRNLLTVSVQNIREVAPSSHKLTIATAIPKGDRQRTMVDMLTQLSVSEIIALECDYSVTTVKGKLIQKWQRVAIEACKQSQNPYLPLIGQSLPVPALLESLRSQSTIQAFYTDAGGERVSEMLKAAVANENTTILIGPEGGFSEAEISAFDRAGLLPLRLAADILRTETAAITAAAMFRDLYPVRS